MSAMKRINNIMTWVAAIILSLSSSGLLYYLSKIGLIDTTFFTSHVLCSAIGYLVAIGIIKIPKRQIKVYSDKKLEWIILLACYGLMILLLIIRNFLPSNNYTKYNFFQGTVFSLSVGLLVLLLMIIAIAKYLCYDSYPKSWKV